jgi:hypothetical protein
MNTIVDAILSMAGAIATLFVTRDSRISRWWPAWSAWW